MIRNLYLILVLILTVLAVMTLEKLRYRSSRTLDEILYVKNDPDLYLRVLQNRWLRLLYSDSTIENYRLNAYLMTGNQKKTEDTFKYLDTKKFSKGEALDYNMKKLSYYALHNNREKAKEALDYIDRNLKDESLKEESRLIYGIYVLKDTKLIKKLDAMASEQTGQVKGLSLFRIAKLYHFDSDNRKAEEYLNRALKYLEKTAYRTQIIDCLNDLKKLEDY